MRKVIAYTFLILLFFAGMTAYMMNEALSDGNRNNVLSNYFGTDMERAHPDRWFGHSDLNTGLDSNEVWNLTNISPNRWDMVLRNAWVRMSNNGQADSLAVPNGYLRLYATNNIVFSTKDSLRLIAYATLDTGLNKVQAMTLMDQDSVIRRFNYLIANYTITKNHLTDTVRLSHDTTGMYGKQAGLGKPDSVSLLLDFQIVD